jgi:hypothetical protein
MKVRTRKSLSKRLVYAFLCALVGAGFAGVFWPAASFTFALGDGPRAP